MARKRHIAAPLPPRRPWIHRTPREPAPLSQRLDSDIDPGRPVTSAELEALERLLGEDLLRLLRQGR